LQILVAEDEQVIADSYRLFLESRKHKVLVCYDGEQCLKTFNEHIKSEQSSSKRSPSSKTVSSPFDLIILDYRMPKRNGVEVAEQILSKVPNQRILLATAYSHELAGLEVLKSSPNIEMINKPFEFEVLAGVVEHPSTGFGSSKTLKQSARNTSLATDLPGIDFQGSPFMHEGDISNIFRF
jgi:two-component system cell cycle response regulator CpdR